MARFVAINTIKADTSSHRAGMVGSKAEVVEVATCPKTGEVVAEDGYCRSCARRLDQSWNPILFIAYAARLNCYTSLNEQSRTWGNILSAARNLTMLIMLIVAYSGR